VAGGEPFVSKHLAMVIDLERCVGCNCCTVACKQENGLNVGVFWNRVYEIGPVGEYPTVDLMFLPHLCMHCEDPQCVSICPTGASYKRDEDGVVLINKDACIGCQYCTWACAYGARTFNEEQGLVEKCTYCAHRIDIGLKPACVVACPASARFFGDLNDPSSEVSQALKRAGARAFELHPEFGTNPSTRYIAPKRGVVHVPQR